MIFTHGKLLYFLLILIPFVYVAIINFKKKNQILRSFVSSPAFHRLGFRSGREIDFFKTALTILVILFVVFAMAGPGWGDQFENMELRGIEIVFMLDTSFSMNAEDLKPNRLEVAKQLIINVVDQLKTDYVGLVNFAGKAYVQCPLTIDYEVFKLLTQSSFISPAGDQGTDFALAFETALKTFEASKNSNKLLLLITDGEDLEGRWQEFIDKLREKGVIVFTVGVGGVEGGPIPIKDENREITGWKKDKQGNIVNTKLNEDTLVKIAAQLGGQYFRLSDITSIDALIRNLQVFEKSVLTKKSRLRKIPRFQYPLLIGIICLIFELFLSERTLKWEEKQ